jgi:hypothetical protein
MTPPDDYCELCDLRLSQCPHGRPPTPPAAASPPKPRARTVREPARTPGAPISTRQVTRKWTPSEAFRPHLLRILGEFGGRLDADDLMLELEIRVEDTLTPGDRENAPQGGMRWHIATRRQRKEMIDEGLLVPGQPGVWQLTDEGLTEARGLA